MLNYYESLAGQIKKTFLIIIPNPISKYALEK